MNGAMLGLQAWGAIALDTELPVEVSRHMPSSEDDASLLKLTQVFSHLAQYASVSYTHLTLPTKRIV